MPKQEGMLIMKQTGEGLYLYCLARSGPDSSAGPQGCGQEPVFVHEYKGIFAILGRAFLEHFCVQGAEERLKDPSWVLPRIIRHEKVIEEVMACSPVIPARFATMFSSIARLEELLRVNEQVINDFFDHTAGMSEWGVKGILDRELARDAVCSELMHNEGPRLWSLPPGKRYFEKKRVLQEADSRVREWTEQVSRSLCRALLVHASRFRRRKTPAGESGDEARFVFNWAFLVSHGSLERFQDQILESNHSYAGRGLTLRASGPWPPYSFAPALSLDKD